MKREAKFILLAIGVVVMLLSSSLFWVLREGESRLFPFFLPWDDGEETVTSLSERLDKPAGKFGYVRVGEDGHPYVGEKRIRFLGVNIVGGAAFPRKEDAEKIAARLAKFGINIVRFHHIDAYWESFNIFDKTFSNTRNLNQEALDRLDYFVAKLKENGIYVDLNLLVSRLFTSADGLPEEVELVDWKDQQVLGFFMEDVKDLELEYARQLLTHINPYTGLTYAEDPAVAFVEIVNEQGLIQGWLDGVIDRLPNIFREILAKKWNEYIRLKYGSDLNLSKAWESGAEKPQTEILENGFFTNGMDGWSIEVHDGAEANYGLVEGPDGKKALEIKVTSLGSENWHVQFNYPHLVIEAEESYLVKFMARADKEVRVSVCLMQAHEPWKGLSNRIMLELTTEWKEFEVALVALDSEMDARLDISNLGAAAATYQFSCFSMESFKGYGLMKGESLVSLSVPIFDLGTFGKRCFVARRDWIEFLYRLEKERYFVDMSRYLKEELGVKALVIGTIVGCSTPNIMSKLDVIDTHAYWQHPVFPASPWDPNNWYVVNEPMVNHLDEANIDWLALKRVYGKPHLVSEYNHPAPNFYDAETALTIATYAALQDWDGIFFFDYGSRDDWDSKRMRGYFDIDQHPIKMATMIPAHMIFVRGDVTPAKELVTAKLDEQQEIDLIAKGRVSAWNLPDGAYAGIDSSIPLLHRTALILDGKPGELNANVQGPIYISDTGEIIWNATDRLNCVLLVNTTRSIAIVGFGSGSSFDLGSVVIEPGSTLLDDWCVITLSVIEGENFVNFEKLLLIAAGYTVNSGMRILEYESGREIVFGSRNLNEIRRYNGAITCRNSWGKGPTLVEGISITLKIKTSSNIEVWALDGVGKRTKQVQALRSDSYTIFVLGREFETIWYEISVVE
ncbi:MAG: carbohydrate binding domain-containing protein [Thermoproteota archaeon]